MLSWCVFMIEIVCGLFPTNQLVCLVCFSSGETKQTNICLLKTWLATNWCRLIFCVRRNVSRIQKNQQITDTFCKNGDYYQDYNFTSGNRSKSYSFHSSSCPPVKKQMFSLGGNFIIICPDIKTSLYSYFFSIVFIHIFGVEVIQKQQKVIKLQMNIVLLGSGYLIHFLTGN